MVFIGPNRWSDRTVIEQHLQLENDEVESFRGGVRESVREVLAHAGVSEAGRWLGRFEPAAEALAEFASVYCQLALLLQRATGHDVAEHGVRLRNTPGRLELHFEYEQLEVGARAAELALLALRQVVPELRWRPRLLDGSRPLDDVYRDFHGYSSERALPGDAAAICDAAAKLDVPCVKLDRPPYKGARGSFRIRNNGLLMLGHCRFQHIVDGTLCVDRSTEAAGLVSDREALFRRLLELEVPVPRQDLEFRNCVTAARAARAAERVGYPVVVKPATRAAGSGVTLNVRNRDELRVAVDEARRESRQVLVEQFVTGDTYRAVFANGTFVGAVDTAGTETGDRLHPSIRTLGERLAGTLDVGLLALTVVSPDVSRPLEAGGAVVDVEVAPELDRFLPRESPLLARAAEAFVQWLFPPGSQSRIPIVSLTGTNGKTTTSRMIAHVMQAAGHSVSLVSTDGFYVNGELAGRYDEYSTTVIFKQFESPELSFAVIENHFGRIVRSGYAFRFCDIGVCTNVSEDHLGRAGIETIEDLAAVKRSMLERARNAVVLNADNEHTLAMASHFPGDRVCLTSVLTDANGLAELHDDMAACCVTESKDSEDWIVWYREGDRIPVMPVGQIPATLGGRAEFNVHNALQAIATALLAGAEVRTVRRAMSAFSMDYETTPGRLNIYDGLPYTVLVDYAHNPDGLQKLCDFVSKLDVRGRKKLVLDVPANRPDTAFSRAAEIAAGCFERFYCKNFEPMERPENVGPELLRDALIRNGVRPEFAETFPGERSTEAAARALQEADPGDLVVILVGPDERQWLHERLMEKGPHGPDRDRPPTKAT